MAAIDKDFLFSVTQRVFSNWTALRMAVEHGMGTKERAENFSPYITEVLLMNERLDCDELAGELEDYLDTEFNTELQDSSSAQVAGELLRFRGYCLQGDSATASTELEKLPPLQTWILSREALRGRSANSANACESESSDSESSNDNEEDAVNMEVVDETNEWTEVKTRRKK